MNLVDLYIVQQQKKVEENMQKWFPPTLVDGVSNIPPIWHGIVPPDNIQRHTRINPYDYPTTDGTVYTNRNNGLGNAPTIMWSNRTISVADVDTLISTRGASSSHIYFEG